MKIMRKLSPPRAITLGFMTVILMGACILMLPISLRDGQTLSFVNALFTSTSAVCVTGLVVVDTYTVFSPFGQTVLALLIQIGGLGVTSVGVGVILAMKKKIDLKGRQMIRESLNLDTAKGLVELVRNILFTTLCFEAVGAVLSFLVFSRDYSLPRAIGMSMFHSVATFNNAGFDIIGGVGSLIPYQKDVPLNLSTAGLILCGGIGFLVIQDIRRNKRWKKLQLHSKVVIAVTLFLTAAGTLLLKVTQPEITWLGAFFQSITTRTAGFSTYDYRTFSQGALLVMGLLMFIGASPGSTGGGIKTSTVFVMLHSIKEAASKRASSAFHYRLARSAYYKASVVMTLGIMVVGLGVFLISLLEPQIPLSDLLFEIISAFSTTGLSTGITPKLGTVSKVLEICIMFIGRLGAMTIVSLWSFKPEENVSYPEGNIMVG